MKEEARNDSTITGVEGASAHLRLPYGATLLRRGGYIYSCRNVPIYFTEQINFTPTTV